MAWNLTDDSFIRGQADIPVTGHKFGGNCNIEQHEVFNILIRLKKFRDEGVFCDLKLHVGTTQFDAHKAVVAAWSPKLANALISQKSPSSEIIIQYENEKTFADCLEYMYSGNCSVSDDNVEQLLELGDGLRIEGLVMLCEGHLQKSINLQDFVRKHFLSLKYGLKVLEEIVVDFIETNIATVIEQLDFLNLQPPDLKVFLTSGKMNSVKQEVKFSLIISWVGYNIPERDKYLLFLFNLVNWTHSVNELLIQISCTQNIFTTNEFCLFQLLHSLVTVIGHHLGPFITAYPRLFSMYSHMLEDLSHPNAFLAAGQYQQELAPIVVSQVPNAITKPLQDTKDTAVNTDFEFDLSGFQTSVFSLDGTETCEEANKVEILKEATDTELSVPESSPIFESASTVDTVELEIPVFNVKHRRKSLPRKLPQKNGHKEPKERRRKQKKAVVKEVEDKKVQLENEGNKTDDTKQHKDILKADEKEENTVDYILADKTVEKTKEENKTNQNIEDSEETNNFENQSIKRTQLKITLKKGKGILKKGKSTIRHVKTNKQKQVVSLKQPRPVRVSEPSMKRVHCTYENCDFSAKAADVLEKHVERVHMLNVNLSCWKCDFTAREMRDLCQHLKEHFPKSPFVCDVEKCTMRFLRLGLLVRHHMSHMKEKPYQCDFCTKTYATYNQLSSHKKLHEGGRQFECDVCFKKFSTKGAMQQHRAIHFDNKPYLCDLCGFSTKHQSHLISHRKIHTGDVKKCTFPGCNYSTPKSAHMTQHMNSHLNIRNHICQVCGKSFVVRGKLLRHERIHLKEKLFKCKQCEYQTSRTDRMKLHIESHGIKLKKKNRNNMASGYDYDSEPDIDYHQFYEKVHTEEDSGLPTQVSVASASQMSNMPFLSISDMKPMDVISFAASSSMIMDNYNTARLTIDPLSTAAAVASIEDIQGASTFQPNFERIHNAAFDQL